MYLTEKELQKLIKETLLENPELLERILPKGRYWPWEKEADVLGTLKDLPKDTYKTAKKAVQGAGDLAKKVGKGGYIAGKAVKDMAIGAKDWTNKTRKDIGRAAKHLYTHGGGDVFSPPPGSAAAMKDTGVERGTGERYRIPAHIAHNVLKQQAEKDFFQGPWAKESADFQTPEEYQEESDELLLRYVGAPAAGALGLVGTGLFGAAGGATSLVGAGGSAGTALTGFKAIAGATPVYWLSNKLAIAAGLSPAAAKAVGIVMFLVVEGKGLYEQVFCEKGFKIYDDVLKVVDPVYWISSALQRAWPGGESGKVGLKLRTGGDEGWGITKQSSKFGGDIDWSDKKSVYNTLDTISESLMNTEDRKTVRRLRGNINQMAEEVKAMEGRGDLCREVIEKFKKMEGAKEALSKVVEKYVLEDLRKSADEGERKEAEKVRAHQNKQKAAAKRLERMRKRMKNKRK